MTTDVTISVVTLSGERLDLQLDATARCVGHVRQRCVEHFGLRARLAKLLQEDRLLEDELQLEEVAVSASLDLQLLFEDGGGPLAAAERAEELELYQEALCHIRSIPHAPRLTRAERECFLRNAKKAMQPLRDRLETAGADGRKALAGELEILGLSLLQFIGPRNAEWTMEDVVGYGAFAGDVHRYLASCAENAEEHVQSALGAYQAAMADMEELSPLNPVRLGLCLNCAVFYREVVKDEQRAVNIARCAFDDAVGFNMGRGEDWELEGHDKASVARLLQMLRDNLTLWTQTTSECDE